MTTRTSTALRPLSKRSSRLAAISLRNCGRAAFAALCLAILGAEASAEVRTWNQKNAGTNEWNAANFGGTLPTAGDDANFGGLDPSTYRPSGDQTITGDGVAKTLDFHNNVWDRSRTFTGDITASNLVLRVGSVNVEGTLTLTGTGQAYSLVGAAVFDNANPGGTLTIRNGGTLRADGVHGICVGRRGAADNTAAAGRVVLEEGGTLVLNPSGATASMAGLQLGRLDGNRTGTYSASYVQKGGTAVLGRLLTGFEKNTFAGVTILGGTLDMPRISADTRFRIGHYGYGAFQLLGGDVYAVTNHTVDLGAEASRYATRAFTFEIGMGRSIVNGLKGAYFYGNGGSFTTSSDFSIAGQTGADTGDCAPLHATLDGAVCVTSRTVRVGANAGGNRASLNLNGGTLKTDFIFANEGRGGISEINANGGTIVFGGTALQQQFLFLDAINIYEGGLEINALRPGGLYIGNAGTNVLLRTPAGYGVDVASLTPVNSNLTPPWIEITGGSGSGASAVALIDNDTGTMTNAVIACRGEGYAEGDTPVAKIIRPYGTTTFTDRLTLSVSRNKPGALVKTGGQNLVLFAQPEFEGIYECRQGWLQQTTTAGVASPKVSAVVVGGSDAHFQAGSGNATAVEANWNPVNPAATLTLGTAHGPGTLNVPGAASGQTKPFEQTFASLTVNGTGNAIDWAGGNSQGVGAKVSFGAIACAEGSSLTIPAAGSTFKVYATGATPGKTYPSIHFADKPDRHATVAADGQLVPADSPFVMVIR